MPQYFYYGMTQEIVIDVLLVERVSATTVRVSGMATVTGEVSTDLKVDIIANCSSGGEYAPTLYQQGTNYWITAFGIDFGAPTNEITLETFNANITIMQGGYQDTPTAIESEGGGRYWVTCHIACPNDDDQLYPIPQQEAQAIMTHTSGVLTFADNSPIPSFTINMQLSTIAPM